MSRLTRAETQERNRAKVLAAARDEFVRSGYREAKVDRIAERAGLTRGAVYSNFPGKRALYLAVLAEHLARPLDAPHWALGRTVADALGALARSWVARLPLTGEPRPLDADLVPEVLADETVRRPYAQLTRLGAVLLGLTLEELRPGRRLVRVAEAALTTLYGARQLSVAAPGFVEPFNVVRACAALADVDLGDEWLEPGLATRALPVDEPWTPPAGTSLVTGEPVRLTDDGVVAILGLHRASAAEDIVRAAPPGAAVTAVLVTGDPAELGTLATVVLTDVIASLRQAVPATALPRLRVVCDEPGAIAAAAGVSAVSDATETVVRVAAGRLTGRAEGLGAGHTAGAPQGMPAARERPPGRSRPTP